MNKKQHDFVRHYALEPKKHGAAVRAARLAGYGTPSSSAQSLATIAHRLLRHPEVAKAIECVWLDESSPRCQRCDKPFPAKGNTKYCSAQCYSEANSRRIMAPARECHWCQSQYRPKANSFYCSAECRHLSNKARIKRQYKPKGTTYVEWVTKAKASMRALQELGIEISTGEET